jgi:hypothetical protein
MEHNFAPGPWHVEKQTAWCGKVSACYSINPGNFAGSLYDLREYATKAREAVAKATT